MLLFVPSPNVSKLLSHASVNREEVLTPRACVCLLFSGETCPPALLGMLAALRPSTSWLLPNHCSHTLHRNQPLCSRHKGCAATTWLQAGPSSEAGPQPRLLGLSPWREQELETSMLTPKRVFFKTSGRTCVYWQFINKHQPPCKLFTMECSEVQKCEYK